jgi:hypothetical protein
MEKEIIKQLLDNNTILAETTSRLVEVNRESLQMTQGELSKNKTLMNYIKEEFQALSDKSKRSIQEESQYHFLRKLLLEK